MRWNRPEARIVFAGGGTGGHLAPGVALAGAVRELCPRTKCFFLTSGRSIENKFLDGTAFPTFRLGERKKRGTRSWGLAVSTLRSRRILRSLRPQVVVGLGGATSVGPVLASRLWSRRTAVVLLEQNASPGRATRWLARWADRIYGSLPLSQDSRVAERSDLRIVGNPLRSLAKPWLRSEAARSFGLDPDRPTLAVLGGSQGASSLNRVMIDSLPRWASSKGDGGVQVIHVTGEGAEPSIETAYQSFGVEARVVPFVEQVGRLYGGADLVFARSGGTTVSELAQARLPAVFVPYPWHRDEHQLHNARALERSGGALILREEDLSPESVAREVIELVRDPSRLAAMREGLAKASASEDVAERIGRDLLEIARNSES